MTDAGLIRLTLGDKLVLLLALALLPPLYLTLWNDGRQADQARIVVGGQPWRTIDLHHDQRLVVPGALGNSVLEVHGGKLRFVDSPCDNKHCVQEGWIHHGGETLACLPNKVSATLLGGEQRFDAINF